MSCRESHRRLFLVCGELIKGALQFKLKPRGPMRLPTKVSLFLSIKCLLTRCNASSDFVFAS